jgi:acetyl esterase/lipase
VVLVGVALPLGVDLVTPWPAAAIVRIAFAGDSGVAGPYAAAARTTDVHASVPIAVDDAPDAALQVITPAHANADAADAGAGLPLVFMIHGGGFVGGSTETVETYAKVLASQGYVVASLDYTLAPEAQYPVPIRQAAAAMTWIRTNADRYDVDPSRVVIAGDSAGAQLASQFAAVQTNPALASAMDLAPSVPAADLRGVVLFCGIYDMSTVGATGFPGLRTFLWSYTGHRDWTDAPDIDQLSTVRQATSAYPPTYVTVGNADPLEGQGRQFASVLRGEGVDVTSRFWAASHADLGHEYQFDLSTSAGRTAFDDVTTFLEEHTR